MERMNQDHESPIDAQREEEIGHSKRGGGCCSGRRGYHEFAMRLEDWALKRSIAISFILGISLIGVGLIDFFVNSPLLQGKSSLWGRYLINIGLALISKRIMRWFLRCIIKYILCFRALRVIRYYFVILFEHLALALYALCLLFSWLFLVVEYDNESNTFGNVAIPKIHENPNWEVWVYYAFWAFVCYTVGDIFAEMIVVSISTDYFVGDYSVRLKAQLHSSYLLQALASSSPYIPPEGGHEAAFGPKRKLVENYFLPRNSMLDNSFTLPAVMGQRGVTPPPVPRTQSKQRAVAFEADSEGGETTLLTREEAVEIMKWRQDDSLSFFPLTHQEYLTLPHHVAKDRDHFCADFDKVDLHALEKEEATSTTITEISRFYAKHSRLRIDRLIDHQVHADTWIERDLSESVRADQIKAFASYVYKHAVTSSRTADKSYHGSVTETDNFLDAKVLELFFPDKEMHEAAMDLFVPVEAGSMQGSATQREFETTVLNIFCGHRHAHTEATDMFKNLRVLSTFARIPILFIAACVWGAIVGADIWGIGNSLIALSLGFSFIFGKALQELIDGIDLVFFGRPFNIGDTVILDGAPKAYVRQIGVYSCSFESTVGVWFFYRTCSISGMKIINWTKSPPQWDLFFVEVNVGFTAAKLKKFREEIEKFYKNDPKNFNATKSYVVLSAVKDPLKTQIEVLCNYQWNFSIIRRINTGRSRIVHKLQTLLAELGVEYTSNFGAVLRTSEDTMDDGPLDSVRSVTTTHQHVKRD
ncbi:hypothetical protein TrVE_jg11693 [Triparma verrucosa]|uniref:Mechanosensitive ion channel protein n=1 Tax=Triparma verrucosa TaxID=1606542 RepID=A0A9W7ET82_9STRA|nr:hypothetical protein TrVE_jg11693 [Triparma verrucosa]